MIRLSASAFDVVLSDLGHATPPPPLHVPGVGATHHERAAIRREVYANLAERGLAGGDEPVADLRARLDLLARPSVTVECEVLVALDAAEPVRAVAAARGGRGVLAVQPRRTIAVSEIRDSALVDAVVGVLPEVEAGPGTGVNLPDGALGAGTGGPDNVFGAESGVPDGPAADRRARVFERQATEVRALCERPILGAGQFCVRREAGHGLARVGGVSWFRTDEGAYLGTVAPGRGGQRWLSVVPADRARLAARVADLLDESN